MRSLTVRFGVSSMDGEKWIWVTWINNGKPAFNGNTHKVPTDTLVTPAKEIKPGDRVTV